MSRFPLTFAFALATALVGHAVRAEEPNSAAPPKPAPSVAPQSPVERALEKQVSIKLKDTPLKEAAAYLADISGVNVLLDSKALANDGIPEDRRMTFELPNVPFGAALEMMLRDQELSYAILDGQVLLITTPQAAKEHVITHVYAAGDLVTLHDRSNELKHADVDMDSLIDLVTTSCHPTSWSTQGGNGAITYVSGGLVVSNRSDVQQEVRGLLDDLRRIRNEDNKDRLPTVLLIGDTPADAEVRRRLDRREDIALENASLEELRSFLKSRGLQTILDQKAINDAGFTADAKFSLKLHDVPLGFDLRTLLAQHELACYGEAGLLMITSQAAEKDHVQVGVYPVRDLVSEQPDDTADNFDFDSLIDAITSTVSPTAWGDNGGPGAIGPFSNPPVLVINQSQEIHHQISDLLERLRAQKAASAKTAAKSPHPGESPSVIRVHRVAGADDAALDQFISVIRALIEPKTWDHGDVYIAKLPGAIVVRQTPGVQKRIDNLIAEVQGVGIGGLGGGGFGGGGLGGGAAKPGTGGAFQVAAEKVDEKDKVGPADSAATEQTAVERALAKPISFEFVETPLKDVAEKLSKQTGLNVLLDAKAITDAGGTVDMPITRHLAGIKLRPALRLMLAEHDLAFLDVDDNTLMITSAAAARDSTVTRFYDVHDLTRPAKVDQSSPLDEIIDLVTQTVAPTSWTDSGGTGSISSFETQLVVTQSREIHEQIADLLSTVRHVRDEPEKYRDGGLSQQSPAETKIHRLLQSKQDMDFTETPLKDVVESLKLKVGIEIQVDAKAITDSGVSIDAPITFKVKNMRLATALRLMLAPVELSYIIDHEVLLITSAAAANDHVITRLYAVGDLLNQPPDDSASYQELIDLVTSTVHPASWVDAGGTGSIQPFPISKALVCTQTEQGHEEIVELLKRIRSLKPAKSAAATGSDKTSGEPPTRFYRLSPELADGAAEYITAIKRLVEPSAWAKDDAYIGKVPDGIVARCSPTMHQRIRELLTELEALPPKGAAESGTGIRKKGGVGGQVSGAF